ncbi:MAG: heme exporter protein CcmD [Magnetococcales bacterium]|nr:heme exporter protein CcmD [Magnetococcales bacterium]
MTGSYTEYVIAVYLVAFVAYGGFIFMSQRQSRRTERDLEMIKQESAGESL